MAPRVLVIRGGAIGDFILTLPAIRLLREKLPVVVIDAEQRLDGRKRDAAVGQQRLAVPADLGGCEINRVP